ncbi:MAG TPA: hypothetical protein VHK89_04675 [Actinomycetota bacterium]|jgi:hypothetical protein|nr:hypothetical protein [Actinomycetota bacterium]
MDACLCLECGTPSAALAGVMTGAELVATLLTEADERGYSFEPVAGAGECLVYTVECQACGECSLQQTQRLDFEQDPEPTA